VTPSDSGGSPRAAGRFGRVLLRVLVVQVVALALLWLLQARYTG